MARRRIADPVSMVAPDATAALIELLSEGQSVLDPFLEFDLDDGELEAAWRVHRVAVTKEYRRRHGRKGSRGRRHDLTAAVTRPREEILNGRRTQLRACARGPARDDAGRGGRRSESRRGDIRTNSLRRCGDKFRS